MSAQRTTTRTSSRTSSNSDAFHDDETSEGNHSGRGGRRNEPHRAAIYATALTAFFAIAGIAVVDPILPVIGAQLGASVWQTELLFTAYIAVMALGMTPAVIATGRFGYKKVLATGVGVVALAACGAAASTTIGSLALLRGLWGLGNAMFFATALTLLVALANDTEWVVELFETCLGGGFAVGPLIGGLLGTITWRAPFLACGLFMLAALILALRKLRDPAERPGRIRLRDTAQPFRRPAFLGLGAMTATYNFVFFLVLGFTPVFLHLAVIPLGLVFTAWGVGLAFGILVIGHRLAHRIGALQTVGAAMFVLLAALVGLATSLHTAQTVAALILAGVCMGVCNANLTDLALAAGHPDRRITTGAFNFIRWGFAAPAPVAAGLLAEHLNVHAPFWVGVGVLAVGVLVFAVFGRRIAAGVGERVFWSPRDVAPIVGSGPTADPARAAGASGVLGVPDVLDMSDARVPASA